MSRFIKVNSTFRLFFSTVLAFSSLGGVAEAATVQSQSGDLLLGRQNNGFRKVSGTAEASVGDTVTSQGQGFGIINYPNGCSMKVAPGAVVTVVTPEQCLALQGSQTNPTTGGLTPDFIVTVVGAGAIAGVVAASTGGSGSSSGGGTPSGSGTAGGTGSSGGGGAASP